jgi:hypothetical protein
LDCELSVFPCFVWFGVFSFTVWAFRHVYPVLFFLCVSLNVLWLNFEWYRRVWCHFLDYEPVG